MPIMGIEIERKFLVNKTKWEASNKGEANHYRQGYMHSDPVKTVRVRLTDTAGYITIKGPTVGMSRPEYEYSIPQQDAKELLDRFCGAIVSKYRYKVYVGNKLWEVDEFQENNAGLIVAEIELQAEDELFELPEWIEKEVTGEKRYNNSKLAIYPYQSWEDRTG
jgi:adenylate cyclase